MNSEIKYITNVKFPEFTGIRVLMMPFFIHDPAETLPACLQQYVPVIKDILSGVKLRGVGYLTVDEARLKAGEYHRRPGLHVDGVGEDGSLPAAWGGGGGGWGSGGMYIGANVSGCRGWTGKLNGKPGPDGNCAHITPNGKEIVMKPGAIYWCSPMALHEALPMNEDCHRQFIRISMPNNSPWYESCTPNPLGIKATGPVHSYRTEYMKHRP